MTSELSDFIYDELLPRVLENMDTIFPERNWVKRGYRWSSPYHADGSESQSGARERSYIKTDSSKRFNVGETDGGSGMSLINYALIYKGYARNASGQDFIETVKWLCKETDLQMPEYNSQEYEEYKKHSDTIQEMYAEMQKALFGDEGKEVLAYLTDVRGYDIDLIKKMGLGFISKELADRIRRERIPLSYNPAAIKALLNDPDKDSIPKGVGITHQLAIPYLAKGSLKGFKFREIKTNYAKDGKPLSKYYNNLGLPKSQYLFGFRGFYLSGNGAIDRDITIVEGEFDALHAQILGLENVVAAAGGEFSVKVIQEAKARGVARVTLLLDTEESEGKQEKTYEKIEKGIKIIREGGLTAYYAALPSEEGRKMDVDEFLRNHTVDDLREIIRTAEPASYYLFERRLLSAIKRQDEEGGLTAKILDEFMKQSIEIANSPYTTPFERDMIFRKFEEATGSQIRKEVIEEEADIMDSENIRKKTQKLVESKLQTVLDNVKREGYSVNLKDIDGLGGEIRRAMVKSNLKDYLEDDTDEVFESFKQDFKVIKTDIEFRDKSGNKTRFIIPPGITTIAAHTGHGKSKIMQHVALAEALNGEDGCVVYIPYEESKKQVISNMLNIYANLELTREVAGHGNSQTINEFLHDGSTKYMKADKIDPFKRKLSQFKEILHQRKIKVIKPETPYLSELMTILNSVMQQQKFRIKAVFIDYVQEIYIENTRYQRPDELKEVMVELDLFTQRNSIPVVLAAQLNATSAETPLALTNQCIADSYWIARKSGEIIIVWSSKEGCKKDQDNKMTEKVKALIPGFNLGEAGQLYMVYTKSRTAPTGITAILDINGNTGRIKGNYVTGDHQQQIDFNSHSQEEFREF